MPVAPPSFSSAELTRYSRNLLLDEVGIAGQHKLASARVLVVGAGGLGSPAALYLAAAGVGTLGIADFDRVETHNLQRQLLHDDDAVGAPKVESAVRRLRATNPFIEVIGHPEGITVNNAVALFSTYDIIVDGTDNFSARYLNNDAAFFAKKPLVFGSIFKFEGQVSVFTPVDSGPCYRCLFPEPPLAGSVPGCGEAGVIGALCGVIGSLQALETIKLIVGIGQSLAGRLLTYNALTQDFQTLTLPRDPHCSLCGSMPTIHEVAEAQRAAAARPFPSMPESKYPLEVTVLEAKRLLDVQPERTQLIDVREPFETEICRIDGARCIPMGSIAEHTTTLPRDRLLLVLCHHGGRSQRVTEYLRAQGFTAVSNIAGGIDAWAQTLDPALRRY